MNNLFKTKFDAAVIVLIHTGAVRVQMGALSQGQVVALYNYMSQILVELIKMANLIITLTKAAACGDRSTAARPMADYTLQDAMELALSTPGIDGVVLDPWSHSATLDGALLNGLLHAGHTPEEPGDAEADAGKEAARKGCWEQAVECFEKAAELGSAMGLALLADCIYRGRGTRTNRAKARRMWKEAADSGEILSNIALGDDYAARGDNGRALLLSLIHI